MESALLQNCPLSQAASRSGFKVRTLLFAMPLRDQRALSHVISISGRPVGGVALTDDRVHSY